jgi:STE24 endopeptidase
MSKDTKKANAGFAGIGRSKRIILSDTLIENFTFSEISVIFAHEMGHYTKRHIWKNLAISSALILASFFLCESFYSLTLEYLGFSKVYDLAALPILFFYLSLVGIFLMPAANAVSRRFEREADRYAIKITNDKVSFVSSMEKLADLNIADRNPHPAVVFFFYSHPAINQRIAFAEGILP